MFPLFSLVIAPISRRKWMDWELCTWMTLTNFQIRGTRVFESSAKFPYLEGYSHHLLVSSPVWVLLQKNDPISLIFFGPPLVTSWSHPSMTCLWSGWYIVHQWPLLKNFESPMCLAEHIASTVVIELTHLWMLLIWSWLCYHIDMILNNN
jgi:hypothetical protein